MQQDADRRKSGLAYCNVTPEESQRTRREGGSSRRDAKSQSQENKRRINYSPRGSPDKYRKTPRSGGASMQGSGSVGKDVRLQLEGSKRKFQSSYSESPDKIQRTSQSGRFVNALIGQWSKHMGMQTPLSQLGVVESPNADEAKRRCAEENRKIQMLQKKLQAAEETVSSLSASHEAELRAKEDILRQLNTDWESITKYYSEISESLKGFQEHKDNLSSLYNNVIVTQQSTVKKLQQELSNMRLKDEDRRNVVATAEDKIANQEKRIQEMRVVEGEMKKRMEEIENKSALEKNRLQNVYTEEKLELTKKQETLTSQNEELQLQLKRLEEEKQNIVNLSEGKDGSISKLEEEIFTCKNKIEDLLCQNTELTAKYENSIGKGVEYSKELEMKMQEIDRLRENLSARQEIETSLAKDLEMIEIKYKSTQKDFTNLQNKFKTTQDRASDLERIIESSKGINERKLMELSKKIETLEKENERVLLERRIKIQDLESSCKLLRENHEVEVETLKKEFSVKLTEMKKTIASQNTAFIQLKETISNMNEEKLNRRLKLKSTKGSYIESPSDIKESADSNINREENVEPNLQEANKTHGIGSEKKGQQIFETKEQEFQDERNNDTQKIISKEKSNSTNQEQKDIYNFDTMDVNKNLQKILSPLTQRTKTKFDLRTPAKISEYTDNCSYLTRDKDVTQRTHGSNVLSQERLAGKNEEHSNTSQKKKIFKTRGTGLRQYGTPRKILKK